jgi:hypothetical protein
MRISREEADELAECKAPGISMDNSLFSTQDILHQLDDCAREFTFPMLDNGYVYLAAVRLTAYRDNARWALVIEDLGASPRASGHDSISNCLYCFGNCLKRPPGTANEDFLVLTEDGEDGPTFDDEYGWYVNENVHTIRIRGNLVPIQLDSEGLTEKGIVLEEPQVNGAELLRALVSEYREQLLASETELRQRVPIDLPMLLRLEEWHHPDLAGDELPSGSSTFQSIANVLVSGDPSRYQPTQPPNTHWSNWPDGGTL